MFKKTLLAIIFLIAMLFATGYALLMIYPDFKNQIYSQENKKPLEVTLEFWGLWDNSDDWSEIIKKFEDETYNFNGQKVNVSINYTKKEFNQYEDELAYLKQKNS